MQKITFFGRVLTLCVATLMLLLHSGTAQAQTPQAIWTADNTTLTFVNSATQYATGNTFNEQTVTTVWSGTQVTATGNNAPGWSSVASSITTVVFDPSFADVSPTSLCRWFSDCSSLKTITGIEILNTSYVYNMSYMFNACTNLRMTRLDLSHFDTSKVTNMQSMFDCCRVDTLDLSSFDTSNVTNMNRMFAEPSTTHIGYYGPDGKPHGWLRNLNLLSFNTSRVRDMGNMFQNCWSLTSLDVSHFDTSNVTNMAAMFSDCRGLTSLDVSHFDTSNVTSMGAIFYNCENLTSLDLSNFDTSKVTGMSSMFSSCSGLTSLDLSNFDTSKVTSMNRMFYGCSGLTSLDLSNFDTSNVTSVYYMFNGCNNLIKIYCNDDWNTGKVTSSGASGMFIGCDKLAGDNGTHYSSSNITTVAYAHPDGGTANPGYFSTIIPQAVWTAGNNTLTFINSPTLYVAGNDFNGQTVTAVWSGNDVNNHTISDAAPWTSTVAASLTTVVFDSSFASARPQSLAYWFQDCNNLTAITDIQYLHTNNVTDMQGTFSGCSGLTSLDLSKFKTSKVTNMSSMFNGCSALTSLDLSSFSTATVTDMGGMFSGCSGLTSLNIPTSFSTSNVTNMSSMFSGCSSLTSLDLSRFNTAKVTDMSSMFSGCSGLTSLNIPTSFSTYNVTNMSSMFAGCSSLTSLNLSRFSTAKVTDMSSMFAGCSGLTSLKVSHFNTANVTDMSSMFASCSGLTSLDLLYLNTSNVTDMGGMFTGCTNLTTIYCNANWNTATLTSSNDMFTGCTSLVGGNDTSYDASQVDATYAHPDEEGNAGYFTAQKIPMAIWTEGNTTLTFTYTTTPYYLLDNSYYNGELVTKVWKGSSVTDTSMIPEWNPDFGYDPMVALTTVVFDPSFADVRPTSLFLYFYSCVNLTTITGIEYLNTSNVTNMSSMFDSCSSLTSLDLSHFDTSNVEDMSYMFSGCSNLTTIICDSTWTADNSSYMFYNCDRLVGGAGTAYDALHIDGTYAHPDEGTTNPGYFTYGEVITANKPGDKETYWATYYYSGSNTVALPAAEQSVTIYTAEYREVEGQRTLVLTKVTDGVIKAGQGVIIESNKQSITMKHSLTCRATDDFFAENELKGRDNACALPTDEGTIYTMGNVGGQLGFYKYTGSQLKARRAYLAIPAGSEAGIRIRFDGEDTATGIDEVQSTIDKVQSATIYDLQGRRVVNPTKGIYIVNGKKVYMK